MVFGFGTKKQRDAGESPQAQEQGKASGKGILSSLREKLGRTRDSIAGGLAVLLSGHGKIDEELLEELETLLISADVGIDQLEFRARAVLCLRRGWRRCGAIDGRA